MTWEIAQPRNKKFKLFFSGPPGSFKTRTALRLADNHNFENPATAVVDTEFGTDHYAEDFAFRRLQESDPTIILKQIRQLVKDPGNIKTLIFDSFSVYYDALMDKWVDRFLAREINSAGNKGEYYTLQPRDYTHINREAAKLVRILLKCDLNIICICQIKDKWEGMKVVGSVFDGYKRLPYYFDTIIDIIKYPRKEGFKAEVPEKDRSYSFKLGEKIPWENDKAIADFMIEKMGTSLAAGDKAEAYDPDVKAEKLPEETAKAVKEPDKKPETETVAEAKAKEAGVEVKEAPEDKEPAYDPSADDSGPAKKETLLEVVRAKKGAKINDPEVWKKMVGKYDVETANKMTDMQARELIKDVIREYDIPF